MTVTKSTFEVSKEGLAKLLERRGGKAFAVTELISNAWDENVARVTVALVPLAQRGKYTLVVEDDNPDGFKDLSHAYTLFAESIKKGDPTLRGRFNLGEKFVIAICDTAAIATTTGTIEFGPEGRKHFPRRTTEYGSTFTGVLSLTKAEAAEVEALVRTLLVPHGITTTFNGVELAPRKSLTLFNARLQTEWADQDGVLRRSLRSCLVELHEPLPGETAHLYELGIPVVELGDDAWHVNVWQKVPLNMDRDNVTPAYLRAVRAEVLNHAIGFVPEAEAGATWITEAIADERVTPDALNGALNKRFGEKRVVFDPSDMEANKRAAAAGYTVIPARGLPKGVAAVAREHGVLDRAGAVTPSPKPYGDGDERRLEKDPEKWTSAERATAAYAQALAVKLLGHSVTVAMVNDNNVRNFDATYASFGHRLEFNCVTLGRRFFEAGPGPRMNSLLIHEFAHDRAHDHLSDAFYHACCDLGAAAVQLAIEEPAFFKEWAIEWEKVSA